MPRPYFVVFSLWLFLCVVLAVNVAHYGPVILNA